MDRSKIGRSKIGRSKMGRGQESIAARVHVICGIKGVQLCSKLECVSACNSCDVLQQVMSPFALA